MTRLVVVCGLIALAVVPVEVGSRAANASQRGAGPRPAALLIGFFEPPADTFLSALNPVTLETLHSPVPLGEYRWTAALSPDRSRLAIGTGGPRGGINIFDAVSLQRMHRVHAGIAPQALAWVSPTRVAAALLCNPANRAGRGCGVVLVDAERGRIVRRWPETEQDVEFLPFQPPLGPLPRPVVTSRYGAVFLLAHVSALAPARVVLVTPTEDLRVVSLPPIQLGVAPGGNIFTQTSGGLGVDVRGERAFVVGVERTLAEIDLRTMQVQYRELEALRPSPRGGRRAILSLDDARLAVFGDEFGSSAEPVGVTVMDTDGWRAQTIDRDASRAAFAGGTLLVYGGRSAGVSGYASDGRRRFRLFDDETSRPVLSVHSHGTQAFVVMRSAEGESILRVVDAVTGTMVREVIPSGQLVDLLSTP